MKPVERDVRSGRRRQFFLDDVARLRLDLGSVNVGSRKPASLPI